MFTQRSSLRLSSSLLKSVRSSKGSRFLVCSFSDTPKPEKKNKAVYDEVVRSNTALKLALRSLVEAQNSCLNTNSSDPLRRLKNQQITDHKQWEETLVENRVRPSVLAPIVEFQFQTLGYVTGLLGKDIASRTALLFEKVVEEYSDENLRILNDNGLEEKDLRKILIETRDKGYDLGEELKEENQIQPSNLEENIAKVPKFVFKTLFDISKKL